MCGFCEASGFDECPRCGTPCFPAQQFVSRRLGLPEVLCAYCLDSEIDAVSLANAYDDAEVAGHQVLRMRT